ncbi:hypothetical protein C8F04DRAFT_177254 [Mycena alexandri]|uniref:MYND-type domain-containing protein n=1 Tax=Mycena alexandri TaxID=1745969 RepID=A0AAD6WWJ5_9AGAR|nr:hypothetical protein C8F04DRAFT_177254 [Mycena alexandri]
MHASLQRDRLKDLPATVQGVATAAADGSFEDFKRLRQIIFVDKTHTSEAVLPVIYQCLDPAKIPTVDVGAPCRAVPVAVLALKTLLATIVPPGVASDLWPRVWAWFQFLDTQRVNIRGMKLVVLRQGFYTIVGCLWASLTYETDTELDSLRFVFALLATVDMSNLVEVMEGAEGSFEVLAHLVIHQITLPSGSEDQPVTQLHLDLLRDVLIFATNVAGVADDGIGPPNAARSLIECLVMRGVLKITVSMAKLSLTTEPDPAPALSHFFQFLRALFGLRNMHAVIPAAVTGGLLGCIVRCAHRPPLRMTHHHLMSLLMKNLSASTVYAEVLLTIKDGLASIAPILAEMTPELERSVVFGSWTYFVRLVEQRLEILQSILMTPRRTCDNLACNKKDWKDAFQKCSRCKHFYYCSKECQSADWHAGGHRAACAAYSEHSLSEQHNLTLLDRAFMRAVLDQEYASCKAQILTKQSSA